MKLDFTICSNIKNIELHLGGEGPLKKTFQKMQQNICPHLKLLGWIDDIIIIGQDNVPTLEMIKELENCNEEACVNPCISYPKSTALTKNFQNQIILEVGKPQRLLEVDERPEFVEYGGTGVSKISLKAQKRINLLNTPCSFPALDSTLFKLGLKRWHTHYPMHKHNKR